MATPAPTPEGELFSFSPIFVYNGGTMTERRKFIAISYIFSLAVGLSFGLIFGEAFHFELPKKPSEAPVKQVFVPKPVRIPIVIYHSVRPYIKGESEEQDRYDVTPELLSKQVRYLKDKGYTTISFDMLADYFDTGKLLPVKPVILSFDDSWRNQYVYAFPILQKEKVTGTFFVFTNSINKKNHLTWNETREMKAGGMEIGSHTKYHPYLDYIASPAVLSNEVFGSKKILEESIGTTTSFAYPFGEHATSTVSEVMRAGYRIARAIREGNVQSTEDRFTLRGFIVMDDFAEFVRTINK